MSKRDLELCVPRGFSSVFQFTKRETPFVAPSNCVSSGITVGSLSCGKHSDLKSFICISFIIIKAFY